MGKVIYYLSIMSGVMLLFYFMGLIEATPNSTLLNLLLNPSSFQTSSFSTQILAVLSFEALLGAAIIIGVVIRRTELVVLAAFATFLFNLMWDFLVIYNLLASVAPFFAVMIFSVFLVLYMITIVEFWRGRD